MMSETIIVALILATGSVIVSVVGAAAVLWDQHMETQNKINETQKSVNGRMTELLEVAEKLARAQGIATGREEERQREHGEH